MGKGEKKAFKLKSLGGVARFFKWCSIISVVIFVGIVGSFFYFLKTHPASNYKEKIVEVIQSKEAVKLFDVEQLSWKFSVVTLSLSLEANKINLDFKKQGQHLSVDQILVKMSLWKLFLLKIPIQVDLNNPKFDLVEEAILPQVDQLEQKSKELIEDATAGLRLLWWMPYLRPKIHINNASIIYNAKSFEVAEIKNVNIESSFKGIPGKYSLKATFDPVVSSEAQKTYISGTTKLELSGTSRFQDDFFVGFSVEKYQFIFDENLIVGLGFLEKTPGYKMQLSGGMNFIFSPDLILRKIEFINNKLFVSALQINLQAQYNADEGFALNWALPETRVENLYLPIKFLRLLPFKGIVESKIQFALVHGKKPTLDWQISLNNLYADVSKVEGLFDSTSRGNLLMSITTRGRYFEGKIESPKVEAHLDGTNAEIHLNKGQIKKKMGDRLEVLLKSVVKNDVLKLQNFKGFIHTLNFLGKGELKNFSEYFSGGKGLLDFSLITNRIHLRDWSTSFNFLVQSPPLEGFAQVSTNISGPIAFSGDSFQYLNWRIDRFNLTNVRGSFDPKELVRSGLLSKQSALEGRFAADLNITARGLGTNIHNANIDGSIDLTDLGIIQGAFKKEVGIPLKLITKTKVSPNELKVSRGRIIFHTADLGFSGNIRQGQAGRIKLKMNKEIELLHWKDFFPKAKSPLKGVVDWNGSVSLAKVGSFSKGINWMELALDGVLKLKNISGRWPGSDFRINKLNSTINFGKGRVNILPTYLDSRDYKANFSGSARPKNTSKSFLSFGRMLSSKSWDLNFDVNLDSFSTKSTDTTKATAANTESSNQDFIEFLRNKYVKDSDLNLKVAVKTGKLGSFDFDSLKTKLVWKDQNFNMSEFSVNALEGSLSGNIDINAKPFYLRNKNPLMRSTLMLKNLDLSSLVNTVKPEMDGLLDGKATGKMVLTGEGVSVDEFIKKSSGRFTANISDGYFKSFKVLSSEINSRIKQSTLNKWLTNQARDESCIQDQFNATLDANISGGAISVSDSTFKFLKTQSIVKMKGSLSPDLKVNFKGNFYAGPSCLGGDVRKCLGESKGLARLPFQFSGPAAQVQAKIDMGAMLNQVQSCMETTVVKKVKAKVKDELRDNKQIKDLKNKASSALKGIFQGP